MGMTAHAAAVSRLGEVEPHLLREALAVEYVRLEALRDLAARWLRNDATADDVVPAMAMEVLWG